MAKTRVLIVDDEPNIRDLLATSLRFAGFEIQTAANGTAAVAAVTESEPDIILLDVMLPDMNGFSVTKKLRAAGIQSPILFLTARDEVEDKITGLTVGGDDYLTKPFSMEVLLARCRVLLRRDAREKSRYIHIDDLEVDTVNHTVKRGGIDLQLTQREFGVFEALLLREGTVISREQLRLRVWNDDAAVGSNVVDVYVKQLRSKLDDTREPRLIRTVYGAGYILDRHTKA